MCPRKDDSEQGWEGWQEFTVQGKRKKAFQVVGRAQANAQSPKKELV